MTARIALTLALVIGLSAAAPASSPSTTSPSQQLYVLKQVKPGVKNIGIVWNEGRNHSDILPSIERAGASSGIKVFVVPARQTGDVAGALRQLIRDNRIDALWIVRADGLVEREPSRSYLIREATKRGLPVLAPSADWVQDGASLAVFSQGGELRISLNRPASQALGLRVPADLAPRTNYVAAR